MDWLSDFQRSFREPVYGFLATFWPVIAVVSLLGLGWLFASMLRNGRSGGGESSSIHADSDGGDGGGGD